MIVLSGLLVVVSIVLLGVGLAVKSNLYAIYGSIGVSLLAGLFLIVGALQRRGDAPAAAASSAVPDEPLETSAVTPVRGSSRRAAETVVADVPEDVAEAAPVVAAAAPSGSDRVAVVPGRPRYHVASCRFLAGRDDVTTVTREAALSDGYSACGVCRPDDAEAAAATERLATTAARRPAKAAPARKAAAKAAPARKPAAKKASQSDVRAAAAAAARKAASKAAKPAAKKPAKKAAAKPAAKKAPAKKPAKKATR